MPSPRASIPRRRAAGRLDPAGLVQLAASDLVAISAGEGERICEANDAFLALIGYSREELEAGELRFPSITPPEHAERDALAMSELMDRGVFGPMEKEYVHRSGERIPVLVGAVLTDRERQGWLGFGIDIKERKSMERDLGAARTNLEELIDALPVALVSTNLEGNVARWNPAAEALLGWRAAEVVGQRLPFLRGDTEEEVWRRLRAVWRGERLSGIEVVRTTKDGALKDVSLWCAPIRSGTGAIHGVMTVLADISARKQAERRREMDHLVTQVLAGGGPLANVAVRLIEGVAARLDLQGGALWQVDAAELRRVACWPDVDAPAECCVPGEGLVGQIWQTGRPAGSGLGQLGCPVLLGDEVLGVFVLAGHSPVEKDGELAETLQAICTHLGPFLERKKVEQERGRLLERERAARRAAEEAHHRATLLAEVGALFSSSLNYEETLSRVGSLFVPRFADYCQVHLLEPNGSLKRLQVFHEDPARVRSFDELHERYPVDLGAPYGAAQVLRSGQPELVPLIQADALRRYARDAQHLELLERLRPTSVITVPLKLTGRVLGVISFVLADGQRHYGPDDLVLAEEIALRAAGAIENARLYRDAEQASRLKDEFLAIVSHELRTPLTSILGWAELLNSGRLSRKKAARGAELIVQNSRSLSQIIDDLLDVSRIVAGKLRLETAPIDVSQLIQAGLEAVRAAAVAKNIRLEHVVAPALGPISGDANRLQQIIWNLLSNAVKFTQNGGWIRVEVARGEGEVVLRVLDSGIGIAAEFLPFVFDRFRQAEHSMLRTYGGLGLGLAIVRHLVELHGGSVSAASPGTGEGSTFIVTLPLQASRPAASPSETAATKAVQPPVDLLRGLRLLVVEDDASSRELIVTVLSEYGASAISVDSAAAALAMIEIEQFDAMVCDLGMPEEDGFSLIAKVRAREVTSGGKLPTAAMTAYARAEDRARALMAGFQAHLPKPVSPVELVVAVASLVGRLS